MGVFWSYDLTCLSFALSRSISRCVNFLFSITFHKCFLNTSWRILNLGSAQKTLLIKIGWARFSMAILVFWENNKSGLKMPKIFVCFHTCFLSVTVHKFFLSFCTYWRVLKCQNVKFSGKFQAWKWVKCTQNMFSQYVKVYHWGFIYYFRFWFSGL